MAVNKNAVIRYMYLDQMLSDRHHYYTRSELTDKCNERFENFYRLHNLEVDRLKGHKNLSSIAI